MVEDLRRLLELQQVDSRLGGLEREATALPERRARARALRDAAEARSREAREQVEAADLTLRRLEAEVRDREALIERLEGQSGQVKTNEAYRALLREIEQTREAISERETEVLEAMEAVDAARGELALAVAAGRDADARARDEEAAADRREAELAGEIEREREARARSAAEIAPAVLARYERIAKRHAPAVAVASGEVCLGCRTSIPAQLSLQVRRAETIETCSRCGRMLVPEDVAGTA